MDLDKIKKTWNEINVPQGTEERRIIDIIRSKARTAIDKLKLVEAIGLILLLPLLSLPFLINDGFLSFFTGYTKWTYVVFCFLGFIWQAYKLSLLRKVDLLKAGIIQCLKYILKYKWCLKFEIPVALLFVLLFNTALLYERKDFISSEKMLLIIGLCVIFWICVYVLIFLLYKFLYLKQIKKIETALKEIESIENESE